MVGRAFDHRGTATVTIDEDGVIVEFDEAAERLLGYSRAAAVGALLDNLIIPPRLRAAHAAGLRRYRETGAAPVLDGSVQLPALRGDGTEIMIELAVSRVVTAGRPGFAGRMHEIAQPQPDPVRPADPADFHHTVVENSPILMTVFDRHGAEIWSTPAAQRLLGPVSGRPVEKMIEDLVHPDDAEAARVAFGRAAAVGAEGPLELRLRDGTGSWRAVSVRARNLLDHPAVQGLVCYATDVTRARVAERRQRVEATRMMTLLEALHVGVMLQDEHRQVVLANAALVDLFELGVPPERLLSSDGCTRPDGHANLYPDAETAQRQLDAIIGRGLPVIGEEVRLITGRVLERDYTPITMDNTMLGHLWVFRDVTAQAEIRRALEERNRSLSELATLKGEFIDVVSHELRTPLTSISTFASMLTDDATLSTEERSTAATAVRRNADHMMSLVADLILLAKLESGALHLHPQPLDLAALVREAVAGDHDDGAGVRLTAEVVDGPALTGDPALVGQLVDTVLGVLIAGSAPGADIRIRAHPEAPGWRLQVSTTAADAATAERMLSTRLPHPDAAGEHRTGALALMLGRAIATRHAGELTMVMTRPGATITVTLPLRPPDNRAAPRNR